MVIPGVGDADCGTRGFMRRRIWLGILIGSGIGGLVPELWGAGLISYSGVLLSGVGAFVGLWAGYKLG
jgi:predicted MFS family arabinose efflux permease